MASLLRRTQKAIIHDISTAVFCVGEVIPPNQDLAERYRCSTATIDRAIQGIACEGLVRRVRRRGTVVTRRPGCVQRQVCLLQSPDDHRNALLVGPVFSDLSRSGYTVQIVPLDEGGVQALEICARMADQAESDLTLIALWQPPLWQGALHGEFHSVTRRFDRIIHFNEYAASLHEEGVHQIGLDQPLLCRLVMERLVKLGHRRIAVDAGLHPDEKGPVADNATFCRHMLEIVGGEFIPVYFGKEYAEQVPDRLRESGATAYWALIDHHAFRVMGRLLQMGVSIPGEISIVGRNDTPWCQQALPALTSVSMNPQGIARAVMTAMQTTEKSSTILVPPELIVRASTGPVPTTDREGEER